MKIIDTHCHPQFPQYDTDRDEVILRALSSGIGMICVGTDLATSKQAIGLAERYEGLYASVGLHPNDNLDGPYEQDAYLEMARHPKVVAIGEIGLDYFRTTESSRREFQKNRFAQQLEFAQTVGKPAIIHCRDAHEDMIEMLPDYRGVIHSFTGTAGQARIYGERGYHIGLNGIVTFSDEYEEMIRSIPLDRLLLETDAPYLAPVPYRGKRNEPSFIQAVGNRIATIKEVSADEIFSITTKNAEALFGINV